MKSNRTARGTKTVAGAADRSVTFMAVALVVVAAVVMAIVLVVLHSSNERSAGLDALENNRVYCETAVNEFSNASDYMTDEVWQYALDGDIAHLQNYWNEVDGSRTRDKAVQKLLHANLSEQEQSSILRAKSYSDALLSGETWAMRMLAEGYGANEADLPDKVRAYQLTPVEESLAPEDKIAQAREFLYGTTYAQSKQTIRNFIQAFHSEMTSQMEQNAADALASGRTLGLYAVVAVILLMVALIAAIILYARLMNRKNRQLVDALQRAEAASVAKGSFTSRMSHEIRTPLNAVTGFLAIADQETDSAKKVESIKKGRIAANNLLRIVNDVLDLSAIENGRVKIACEPFSIAGIVAELQTVYSSQAGAKNVALSFDESGSECDLVLGDRLRLNQILTNLLSNAIKFTSAGGSVRLVVSQQPVDSPAGGSEAASDAGGTTAPEIKRYVQTSFKVEDTGIGMDPDFLEKVFEPYEQADASISQKYGGTGLGLNIVRGMTEMMGGYHRSCE